MLHYEVTRENLMKASFFNWSPVLQTKCDTPKRLVIKIEFYRFLKALKKRVLYKWITMEEANIEVRKEVLRLTAKYPAAHELGASSCKILGEKFMCGEVTINNTYDVMRSERLVLLKSIAEDREILLTKEYESQEAAIEEASRIPLVVGMLFTNKNAIGRAFLHQYPGNTKMSVVLGELSTSVVVKYGLYGVEKCWFIEEVLLEGGRVYVEDVMGIYEQK